MRDCTVDKKNKNTYNLKYEYLNEETIMSGDFHGTNLIITNNDKVITQVNTIALIQKDTVYEVLITVRNYIHLGYKLITSPQSGSLKYNRNPYKTILLQHQQDTLDLTSLRYIENAIERYQHFAPNANNTLKIDRRILKDFQEIDFSLVEKALLEIS